jgi:hypothetical protein
MKLEFFRFYGAGVHLSSWYEKFLNLVFVFNLKGGDDVRV